MPQVKIPETFNSIGHEIPFKLDKSKPALVVVYGIATSGYVRIMKRFRWGYS